MSPWPNFYHFEDAGIFLELKNIGKVSRDAASTWSGHVFDFGLVFGIGEEEDVRVRKWVRERVRKWEERGRSGIDRWSILVGEELRTDKVRRSAAGFYTFLFWRTWQLIEIQIAWKRRHRPDLIAARSFFHILGHHEFFSCPRLFFVRWLSPEKNIE